MSDISSHEFVSYKISVKILTLQLLRVVLMGMHATLEFLFELSRDRPEDTSN